MFLLVLTSKFVSYTYSYFIHLPATDTLGIFALIYLEESKDSLVHPVALVIFYKLLCNGIPVNGNLLANVIKAAKVEFPKFAATVLAFCSYDNCKEAPTNLISSKKPG
ncbi:MAG: hypothetical protein ABIN25_07910 [Ginsengibacter sp.]